MKALAALAPYLRRHRKPIVLGFVALLVSDAFQLASPWVFKFAVDGLQQHIQRSTLLLFAGLLVGMALLGGVARFFMRRLVIGTSREIEYELRRDFFAKLTTLPFSFFNRMSTGDLMARATNDLNAVRMVAGPGIMYSVNTVVTLATALTLMIILSLRLTLIAMIPLPIISYFMYRYGKTIHKRFDRVQARFSDITARAQEYLSGIRVVKAYAQEEAAARDFRRKNRRYLEENMSLVRVNGLFSPAIGFLAGMGSVLVLAFGGLLVIRGQITLGSFVAFNAYLMMLIWPMIALGWVISILQRGAASMKRMNEVFDAVPEIVDPAPATPSSVRSGSRADVSASDGTPLRAPSVVETSIPLSKETGADTGVEIEFRDVRFTYALRPEVEVLRGISLRVQAGETVAIVGHTGCGKTTLVNLIPRIYDPTGGRVFVNGTDLREISLAELRRMIGYVPQETFLFSRSILDNIALGQPDAEEPEILAMARLARLEEEIDEFPDGYDTMVGERGVTLSGGQKQRAAIARALLRNPRILILDDALASVDTRTEEEILSGLREFMKNRTTLLVSHRVSTVRLADRIVLLEGGRIAEEGTHEDLLARNGIYAELAHMQELEQELEAAP